MKILVKFNNKSIPVFFNKTKKVNNKLLSELSSLLEKKYQNGKRALRTCLDTLISIEILDGEAILHSIREDDSLALSLY